MEFISSEKANGIGFEGFMYVRRKIINGVSY